MKIFTKAVIDIASGKLLECESFEYHGPLILAGGGRTGGSSTTEKNIPDELKPLFTQTGQRTQEIQDLAPISGFLEPRPAEVAPLSPTQRSAISGVGAIGDQPLSEALALEDIQRLPGVAGRTPGTADLRSIAGELPSTERLRSLSSQGIDSQALLDSPFVDAAQRFFESEVAPGIENRATLSGLGRSTALENARARAEAASILPAISEASRIEGERINRQIAAEQTGLGLEERGIGRRVAAEQTGIGVTERGITREAGAVEAGIPQLRGISGAETGRRLSEFEAGLRGGDVERGVEQDTFNAEFADFIRQQAISEQALFGPLGQLPSTFGQSTKASQSGGGLFK